MIEIKTNELKHNTKEIFALVKEGESFLVKRPDNDNVVVLSEKEYNALKKAAVGDEQE